MDSILESSVDHELPVSRLEQCEVVEEKSPSSQKTDGKMAVVGAESSCVSIDDVDSVNHYGVCVICFNKIMLEETALVKGCEHAYCVTCILRWASCKKDPTCPQCKNPFEFLNVHRSLDGSIHDYMFEESVCLLLRASWFVPLRDVEESVEVNEDLEYQYQYQYMDEEDELDDEVYFGNSSSLRIGNRRWGDNGYVRAGRQEARPVHHSNIQGSGGGGGAGPSRQSFVKKEAVSQGGGGGEEGSQANVGRRAKRAMKREAADKAAAAKHQQHLVRLGRK